MQFRQSRQEGVELAGIIGREHARQPIVSGIVDSQACLDAGELLAAFAEQAERFAQLVGFRNIFGIIDDRIGAARKWQLR